MSNIIKLANSFAAFVYPGAERGPTEWHNGEGRRHNYCQEKGEDLAGSFVSAELAGVEEAGVEECVMEYLCHCFFYLLCL